jgi:signal transduction histidine kinase
LAEALNDIDKTVLRISRIIKGLRNISRDASDEECAEVALADVFSEVLAVCAEKFRNNQVELRLDLADEERPVVKGRRVQLSQVVLNLLSNAFDAVEKLEGARWVELKVELDEAELVITVRDSGPGIPAHLQEKIFQPFFSTKDVGKGTGLGLSLSKAIVEKHGGALGLETVGGHTQFTVRLPLKSSLRAA